MESTVEIEHVKIDKVIVKDTIHLGPGTWLHHLHLGTGQYLVKTEECDSTIWTKRCTAV